MDKEKKAVWGWAMYDWANSAFATTVMAGFFPIFFFIHQPSSFRCYRPTGSLSPHLPNNGITPLAKIILK